MVGASSLCTLLAGTSIINPEFRAVMSNLIAGDPSGQLAATAARALGYVHSFSGVLGDYRMDNTPAFGFGILAVVLTAMMVKA